MNSLMRNVTDWAYKETEKDRENNRDAITAAQILPLQIFITSDGFNTYKLREKINAYFFIRKWGKIDSNANEYPGNVDNNHEC